MQLQDKDIELLRALRDFLKTSFRGASFNGLKIDECESALSGAIAEITSAPKEIWVNEMQGGSCFGHTDKELAAYKARSTYNPARPIRSGIKYREVIE